MLVHSEADYETAVAATNMLFGNADPEALKALDETTLLQVFEAVPSFEISAETFGEGMKAVDLATECTPTSEIQDVKTIFGSKGEMRKLVQGGGVSINKSKLTAFDQMFTSDDLLQGKYLILQKGKKNYFLITVK